MIKGGRVADGQSKKLICFIFNVRCTLSLYLILYGVQWTLGPWKLWFLKLQSTSFTMIEQIFDLNKYICNCFQIVRGSQDSQRCEWRATTKVPNILISVISIFLSCVFFHKFQSDYCQALSWRQYSHSLCELDFVMLHRCDSWLLLMKLPTKSLLMLLLYVKFAFEEWIGDCFATAWQEHFQSLETYCHSLE